MASFQKSGFLRTTPGAYRIRLLTQKSSFSRTDPDFTECENDALASEQKRLSTLVELNKVATWLMNEDSRTDKAKSHLKKAIITEAKAVEVAGDDRFITKLECVQKVILQTFTKPLH